ncbi:hypothetical protein Pfo_029544 [Paulownia fortunei]|nr:hypothetical protein Pfo_029544 [Paulownia fortunei]
MGTLSSRSFSLNPPNGFNFRGRFQNNSTKCFLCGELLSKRRRLIWNGNLGRLNFMIRSCYKNSKNNRNDDNGVNGQKENKDNSNLATMTSAEKKSDDNSDKSPAFIPSRPLTISPVGPAYSNFQVDSFKMMELLGPEKVDPADVKVIKEKLFGYSTF